MVVDMWIQGEIGDALFGYCRFTGNISQLKINAFLWSEIEVTNYDFYLIEVIFLGGECLSNWFFWIKFGFAATAKKIVAGIRKTQINKKRTKYPNQPANKK